MHAFSPSCAFALLLWSRDRVRYRSTHDEVMGGRSNGNSTQKVLFVSLKNKDLKRNVRLSGEPGVVIKLEDELVRSSTFV